MAHVQHGMHAYHAYHVLTVTHTHTATSCVLTPKAPGVNIHYCLESLEGHKTKLMDLYSQILSYTPQHTPEDNLSNPYLNNANFYAISALCALSQVNIKLEVNSIVIEVRIYECSMTTTMYVSQIRSRWSGIAQFCSLVSHLHDHWITSQLQSAIFLTFAIMIQACEGHHMIPKAPQKALEDKGKVAEQVRVLPSSISWSVSHCNNFNVQHAYHRMLCTSTHA